MSAWITAAVVMASLGGTPDGVVLQFSASWCGPCQQMHPIVRRLQQQGYAIRHVDVDREPSLAQRFNVTSYPTFVLIVRGTEQQRLSGAISEYRLRQLASQIPAKPEPQNTSVAAATAPEVRVSLPKPAPARSGSPKASDVRFVRSDAAPVASSPFGGAKTLEAASADSSTEQSPRKGFFSLFTASGGHAAVADQPTSQQRTSQQPTIDPRTVRANVNDSSPQPFSRDPMDVSVRIRVNDTRGVDIGSGTVIHSEPGRTVILTCGHIFRHFTPGGRIEVDVFNGERPQMFEGQLLKHDLQADIGLISIQTLVPHLAARVAPAGLQDGDLVFSVGCGRGEPPAKMQHLVTSTTKYTRGFVECTGTPVQGRSGGGLFTTEGEVAGVCVFADSAERRGLYTSLATIHTILDEAGLSELIPSNARQRTLPASTDGSSLTADTHDLFDRESTGFDNDAPPFAHEFLPETPFAASSDNSGPDNSGPDSGPSTPSASSLLSDPAHTLDANRPKAFALLPQTDPATGSPGASSPDSTRVNEPPRLPMVGPNVDSLRDTLEAARGSEVVCIIRDPADPQAESRVVIIHRASPRFVSDLTGELENQIQPTSMTIRKPTAAPARFTRSGTPAAPAIESAIGRYRRQR